MNLAIPRRLIFMAASLAVFMLAGCATLRPISSKPPVPKLVLSTPFSVTAWEGLLPPTPFKVILPAGEYRPLYEDDQAYYYQAPSKVVVNDIVSSMYDGGIYVLRGTTAPRGWYYVCEDGSQKFDKFSNPPPTR